MLFIYPAVIHEDADGMWAEFPDLEGCTTYGDTMEEILSGAAEAMELYVLGMMEDGVQPPMPTDIKEIKRLDKNAFATLIQSDVDLAKNTKSVKKTLTIPAWLNQRALDKGINFLRYFKRRWLRKQFNINTGYGRPNGRLLHFLYISGGTYCSMGGIFKWGEKVRCRRAAVRN